MERKIICENCVRKLQRLTLYYAVRRAQLKPSDFCKKEISLLITYQDALVAVYPRSLRA